MVYKENIFLLCVSHTTDCQSKEFSFNKKDYSEELERIKRLIHNVICIGQSPGVSDKSEAFLLIRSRSLVRKVKGGSSECQGDMPLIKTELRASHLSGSTGQQDYARFLFITKTCTLVLGISSRSRWAWLTTISIRDEPETSKREKKEFMHTFQSLSMMRDKSVCS